MALNRDPMTILREAIAVVEEGSPIRVPIHEQTAAAGMGDEILDYVYVSRAEAADRNIVALRVHGNSMEPDVQDGDTVIMDRDRQATPGEMVVASDGEVVVVKWLRLEGQRRFLEGNNGLVDAARWKIDGVVFKVVRNVMRSSASPVKRKSAGM